MSAEEYTETGYLLSWNNGLSYEWQDDDQSCHIRAGNLELFEYSVTTYRAIGHTVYREGRPTNAD